MKRTVAAHLAVLAALALLAGRPLFRPLAIAGHSSLIDIERVVEIDALYRAGAPFSIWAPDLYLGRGAPLFRYYGTLPYHVAELFHLAGLSVPSSLKAVYLISLLLSAFGAYRLFHLLRGPTAGLIGGALYLLAPYRFVNAYVRSALGEMLALAILPWLAAALLLAAAGDGRRRGLRIAWGAGLVAALTVTHNLTAFLALPALTLLLPIALPRPLPRGWTVRTMATLAAGVLLAGVYWYPAFAGRDDVWLRASITEGFFDFRRHFVSPRQLLAASIRFGISEEGFDDDMSFPAGPFHLAAGAAALLVGLRRRDAGERGYLIAGTLLTILPLVMTVPLSLPLWNAIPPLHYVQFPWRFLGLAALGTSWLGAAFVPPDARGGRAQVIALLLASAAFAAALPWISSQYIRFDEKQLLTRAGISGRLVSTTGYHDYLPLGVRALPEDPAVPRFVARSGEVTFAGERSGALRHEVRVGSPDGCVVECRVFWFPGWEAEWNADRIEVLRAAPDGTVVVSLPPGEGSLVVRHGGDPRRREGAALSLLGLAMIALLARRPGDRGLRAAA